MGRQVALRHPSGATRRGELEDQPLGRGGEGTVWRLQAAAGAPAEPIVAKIYHPADPLVTERRRRKIEAMVAAPPATDSICWPREIVEVNGTFAGFTMTALGLDGFRTWAELAHPADRRTSAPGFAVRYALAAARNLGVALEAVHRAGHVVGDVNESNILVAADATVRIVDADSAQVRAGDGTVFRCEVGKPEFTAPELAGAPLRDQDRTTASDVYGYAVLVFQILAGGAHPTDGVPTDLDADPPTVGERIRNRWTPGLLPPADCPLRPAPRIPAAALPTRLIPVLAAAFDPVPAGRTTIGLLVAALDDVGAHLIACPVSALHAFDSRDGACGWCAHATAGHPDPWGTTAAASQRPLPPVTFQTAAPPAAAPRRSPSHPNTHPTTNPAAGAAAHPAAVPAVPSPPGYPTGPGITGPGQPSVPAPVHRTGRRSMVQLPDGTVQPRPPLLQLAARQPVLAARLAWRETPDWVRPLPAPARKNIGSPAAAACWWLAALLVAVAVPAAVSLAGTGYWWQMLVHVTHLDVPARTMLLIERASAAGTALTALTANVVLTWRYLRRRGLGGLRRFGAVDMIVYLRTAVLYSAGVLAAVTAAAGFAMALAGLYLVNMLFSRRR
jgi:hypothetical protein